MHPRKKILIAGAGIAGFLTYLYLDRQKYEVTLVEREERFRTVGYAIVLWNCAFDVLARTLVKGRPEYARRFTKLQKTVFMNEWMFPWCATSLRNLGYIVDREDLLDMFVTEARTREGIMRTGTALADVSWKDGAAIATFSDGTSESFDLIVVCEGINSPTRQKLFPHASVTESRYVVEYSETARIPVLSGTNVIYNIGNFTGVIMTSHKSTVFAHFLLRPQEEYEKKRAALRETLRAMLTRVYGSAANPQYPEATQQFESKDVHLPQFYTKNVVLLADAAHGRVPVLGLGTTLATEDAYFLSNLLNAFDVGNWEKGIEPLLRRYSDLRHTRSEKLYALQDFVTRSSLPKEKYVPDKKFGLVRKSGLKLFDDAGNKLFTYFFRKAATYDIRRDM